MATLQTLPVDSILPNPEQPRTEFDEGALVELATSIKEVGLIQPISVEQVGEGDQAVYILTDGERRLRATRIAGLPTIDAYVTLSTVDGYDAKTRLTRALVANVQRQDLNPLEEALAYKRLVEELGMTHQQIADATGRSRPRISNTLRLVKLEGPALEALRRGDINQRQAEQLLILFELPEPVLKRLKKGNRTNRPEAIIRDALGSTALQIKDRIRQAIHDVTFNLTEEVFPRDHPFPLDPPIRAATCTTCPVIMFDVRCPDPDCRKAKHDAWIELQLAELSAEMGIEIAPADINEQGRLFHLDGNTITKELAAEIVETRCTNLRLCWQTYTWFGYFPNPKYPRIECCCYTAGRGALFKCACAAARTATQIDPAEQERQRKQREREQRYAEERKQIADQAAQRFLELLQAHNAGAWRLLYKATRGYTYGITIADSRLRELSLRDVIHTMASRIVSYIDPGNANQLTPPKYRETLAKITAEWDIELWPKAEEPADPQQGEKWKMARAVPPLKKGAIVNIDQVIDGEEGPAYQVSAGQWSGTVPRDALIPSARQRHSAPPQLVVSKPTPEPTPESTPEAPGGALQAAPELEPVQPSDDAPAPTEGELWELVHPIPPLKAGQLVEVIKVHRAGGKTLFRVGHNGTVVNVERGALRPRSPANQTLVQVLAEDDNSAQVPAVEDPA